MHILDTTHVEVPLETGTYECSGVVKNEDGTLARGDKLATLRTLLDSAGLRTQVALSAIQVHDMALCRPLLEEAPVLRAGDLLLEDRGFIDGATLSASSVSARSMSSSHLKPICGRRRRPFNSPRWRTRGSRLPPGLSSDCLGARRGTSVARVCRAPERLCDSLLE